MAKKGGENPLFKKVLDSQKAFAAARRPVAERLHGRLQDGLQPLLRPRRQEDLSAHATTGGAATAPLFLSCWQADDDAERCLLAVDRFSTWVGKAFAWSVVVLTLLISGEVFSRYVLNKPHGWVLDAQIMLYGTLFMMAGAYTLTQERPRARRRALRLLPAAHAGDDRPGAVHPVLPARHRRADLGRLDLRQRVAGDPRADLQRRPAAALPVQVRHPDGRRGAAAAGPRRDRALRRSACATATGRRASRTSRRSTSTSSRRWCT